MPVIEITSLMHPGVEIFHALTEAQLRQRKDNEWGLFIAESPKVIQVALNAGYQPIALLCEERHIKGDAAHIISQCPEMPVYVGERPLLSQLTGIHSPEACFAPCVGKRCHPWLKYAKKPGEW